ncbi:hypothetical protein TNCV_2830911 [Trichonephila clavipes]|nr:hypothetical protein TNCV_2830911 [Trichonephila clavipes]
MGSYGCAGHPYELCSLSTIYIDPEIYHILLQGYAELFNGVPKVRIVRAQVPPSRVETGSQTTYRSWYRLYGAELKSDTSSWEMN